MPRCPKCRTLCTKSDLEGSEIVWHKTSAFTPKGENEPVFYLRKQEGKMDGEHRGVVCGACIAEEKGVPYG